jgi:hypothetical protein
LAQSAGAVTIRAAIEDAYQSCAATLEQASYAELAEEAAAPWGERMSRLLLVFFSLKHDQEHISALRATNPDA